MLTILFLFLIDIIYSKQCSRKGRRLAEGYQEGFVDLALRVDEDAAEEKDEAPDGEHKGCYEL